MTQGSCIVLEHLQHVSELHLLDGMTVYSNCLNEQVVTHLDIMGFHWDVVDKVLSVVSHVIRGT